MRTSVRAKTIVDDHEIDSRASTTIMTRIVLYEYRH